MSSGADASHLLPHRFLRSEFAQAVLQSSWIPSEVTGRPGAVLAPDVMLRGCEGELEVQLARSSGRQALPEFQAARSKGRAHVIGPDLAPGMRARELTDEGS